jgi:predicted nuclease of predicted toxin-antitoxin system
LVAAVAEMNEAVLVSLDSDFGTLAPRAGLGRTRFRRLSRIALKCSEPQAVGRIKAALSLIEHEWEFARSSKDGRMIIEIHNSVIRTIR